MEKYNYYEFNARLSDLCLQVNETIAAELTKLPEILFPNEETLEKLKLDKQ